MKWNKDSWKNYETKYIPNYDIEKLTEVSKFINSKDIVDSKDIENLKQKLSNISINNSFIIQIGECAETFSQATLESVISRIKLIDDIAKHIKKNTNKEIIKIGRIAGQYSKPRSSDKEIINGLEQNTYKGDLLHSYQNRENPNPDRFLQALEASQKTIDYINSLNSDIYTSHECLILPYESAHTKYISNKYYNTSAHMLWLGYRTKSLNSGHVEYLRGIANPIGIKIGEDDTAESILEVFYKLNPNNEKGKIIFICRFGHKDIFAKLSNIVKQLQDKNLNVIWMVDPMHGNTIKGVNNLKTRKIKSIIEEVQNFYEVLTNNSLYFAGIHLEATPDKVLECINSDLDMEYLSENYKSLCDPRLNYEQSLNIADKINNLFINK